MSEWEPSEADPVPLPDPDAWKRATAPDDVHVGPPVIDAATGYEEEDGG